MRYRPFGANHPMAVSTISLLLEDRARASAKSWRELLDAAMKAGINTFEVAGQSEALLDGLTQALTGLERRLVFIGWRAPVNADVGHAVDAILRRLGLDYLDMLVLADIGQLGAALPLRRAKVIKQIALACIDDAADQAVALEGVDALITPYSLMSGWRDRHRLKLASDRNMAVVAHDVWPAALRPDERPQLIPKGWFRKGKDKAAKRTGYHFLNETRGWEPEEICLAYALTEPAVTTVRIDADDVERITRLAEVPARDMPTGVAAQIEMARFSA
jgi:aryl-alcohol dehydrogenase-like predicted oxidoreductase